MRSRARSCRDPLLGRGENALLVLCYPIRYAVQVLRYGHPGKILLDVILRDTFREPRLEETCREIVEAEPDDLGVRSRAKTYRFIKPVADRSDDLVWLIAMALDV